MPRYVARVLFSGWVWTSAGNSLYSAFAVSL